jgi:hypothetical protein
MLDNGLPVMQAHDMKPQNQIKRTLSEPENITCVRELLESKQFLHRTDFAQTICRRFGFLDARGKLQQGGCLKALRELESKGHFVLPVAASRVVKPKQPRRLSEPVAEAQGVPEEVGEVMGLKLVLVETEEQMRIWNELMIQEHPQGAGPLVGRQLRYLVGSDHGWLGGLAFAAAALKLEDRDRWIGWNEQQRQKYLHAVAGMNRFLIRNSVRCRNLASKILSLSMASLPEDFRQRYHHELLLVESFVDTSTYDGTCYRAANWIPVGKTKGRGRQDRYRCSTSQLSVKEIYVYPLQSDFRKQMGLDSSAGLGALKPEDGLDKESWAENEFGGAPLGDARLSKRLVKVAADKAEVPDRAYSGVAKGNWPSVKAYYRMIDQPDESAVDMDNILMPHRERTIRRMQGQKTVLCIQDGSDLNYNNLDQCEGLGQIGTNQTGAKSRGLHLHSTLAVAPNGLPLGVLRAQCDAIEVKAKQQRPESEIPIEEKKTFVWIEHHRDHVEVSAQMPGTQLIDVCDREADFFELFDEQRRTKRVALLVRARHNRSIAKDSPKLFDAVAQTPVQSQVRVHVPRQSARSKKSKQDARPKKPGRWADMEVRYQKFLIKPPKFHKDKAPVEAWVIHAVETNPPTGTEPIQWFLLTTIAITSPEQAEQCLRWYCLRWRIEDWHRVLKSGCRVEDLANKTADRLRRAIAIHLVIAWRIMLMTLLGREVPQLPAEVLFSDVELRTLRAYAKKNGLKSVSHAGDAVMLIARIGGHLGRKKDPPPGYQIMWQGYIEFNFMCLGFALSDDEGNCPD